MTEAGLATCEWSNSSRTGSQERQGVRWVGGRPGRRWWVAAYSCRGLWPCSGCAGGPVARWAGQGDRFPGTC